MHFDPGQNEDLKLSQTYMCPTYWPLTKVHCGIPTNSLQEMTAILISFSRCTMYSLGIWWNSLKDWTKNVKGQHIKGFDIILGCNSSWWKCVFLQIILALSEAQTQDLAFLTFSSSWFYMLKQNNQARSEKVLGDRVGVLQSPWKQLPWLLS